MRDLPNADYGENATYRELQSSAPLAGVAASGGGAPQATPGALLEGLTGLGAPSQMPGQPVTAGAPAGPGPGPEALGLPADPMAMKKADARKLAEKGVVQAMVLASQRDDATPAFRRYVRALLAQL